MRAHGGGLRRRGLYGPGRGRRLVRPADLRDGRACRTPACARAGTACAARSATPASSSRRTASPSTSRRPTCARPDPRSTCRSRWASWRRPGWSSGATSPISLLLGELSLDGGIQPARGRAAGCRGGATRSVRRPPAPRRNAAEASVVEGLRLYPVRSLTEAVAALNDPEPSFQRCRPRRRCRRPARRCRGRTSPTSSGRRWPAARSRSPRPAGTTCCMIGPPGAGKTMMARRVAGDSAAAHVRRGAGGHVRPLGRGAAAGRNAAACRSGHSARRITRSRMSRWLAADRFRARARSAWRTQGVLFLDEMAEFSRRALEVLRQPLEEGVVRIARAARTASFPARFMLIGAMNPCPCGFAGDPVRVCRCTPAHVSRYAIEPLRTAPRSHRPDGRRRRRSGPRAAVRPEWRNRPARIRARVVAARERQLQRSGVLNARLHGRALRARATLAADARPMVAHATARLSLSARAYDRVLRVARTIADLEGIEQTSAQHVAEALQFRGH